MVKFRRKNAPDPDDDERAENDEVDGETDASVEPGDLVPGDGPYDVDDVAGDGVERVDLGSLLITPEPERELRLQVDEATQAVQAVLLAGADGALELRAFAAPRNGDLWTEIRPQLAADMARRGGTASDREGPFGPELVCQLSVKTDDGRTAQQSSRIIGINGPRWMLRATFLGRPASEPDQAAEWEASLSRVVVRRGDHAMPPGDALPVKLPDNVRRTPPPA